MPRRVTDLLENGARALPARTRRWAIIASLLPRPDCMQPADILIAARWTVPVTPPGTVLEDHALVVVEGKIADLLPREEATAQYRASEEVSLDCHALIPGLVNAHTHAAMTLFRGLADDVDLQTWLHEHIWPAETRWIDDAFVRDGTRLAVAEMLRGGTTCFNDMYFYPEVAGQVASDAGMRACVGLIALDFPTGWADGPDRYLEKGVEVHERFRDDPLVTSAWAPHSPYTVSDAPLERIRTHAEDLDIPIHIHVHETAHEVTSALAESGERPIDRLERLGLLGPRLVAVHMTQLEAGDFPRLAERGVHVVHCPESNLKLASGLCPVDQFLRAGVHLAIGTDGAASNNDLSMLGEMRTACLLGKIVAGDASAVNAAEALEMGTLGGARSLGLQDRIGSLEPGKEADVVAIDLSPPETWPVYHPSSQIVYSASAQQVSDVWVAGRRVLEDRRLLTIDLDEVRARAGEWRGRIAGL